MKIKNENKLQIACVRWFRAQYPHLAPLLYHPRNEAHQYSRRIAIDAAAGVVPGVPDLVLALPGVHDGIQVHSLGIELKYGRNKQNDAQKVFQRYYTAAGNGYCVVNALDTFMTIVNKYIDLVPQKILMALKNTYHEIQKEELDEAKQRFLNLLHKNE